MRHVVFAVPYAMDATLRFVRAAADLPGARLGILSQEPPERLPPDVLSKIAAHQQVESCLDGARVAGGVRALARRFGAPVDRLIGILEPMQEALAEAREVLDIPGTRVETARNFRDKARMKEVLRDHGLPCAQHGLAADEAEALAFAEATGYPVVIKPPDGAGAKHTFRVSDEDELRAALRVAPPRPSVPVLLEEFVQGDEFSFDSVTLNGEHRLHSISSYAPTPLRVMETPWIQWVVHLPRRIDGPEYAAIREAGPRAIDALGLSTGLTHMEWFRRPDGTIAISEVAARPPGAQFTSLLSYAHDTDFYRAWARLVAFDEFAVPERRYSTGAAYLRGQGQGRVVNVVGLEQAQKELGELVVEAKLPQPGQTPSGSYEGEGHVILRHADSDVVLDGLRRLVQLIQVHLA